MITSDAIEKLFKFYQKVTFWWRKRW